MARPTRKATNAAERRKRTPLGVAKLKMSLDERTKEYLESNDLIPRWVNDEDHGQRVQNARDGGYEFVTAKGSEVVGEETEQAGVKIQKLVGSHQDGSPKYAFLMAIPRKFYEEDQQAKEEKNRLVDDAIRGGNPTGLKSHNIDPSKGRTYVKNVDYKP